MFETAAPVASGEPREAARWRRPCGRPPGRRRRGSRRNTPSKPSRRSSSTGFWCTSQCDGDARNPIRIADAVRVARLRRARSPPPTSRPREHGGRRSRPESRRETDGRDRLRVGARARGRRLRAAAAQQPLRRHARARPEVGGRPDARLHAGSGSSTTGTCARSPASAKGRASGRRTAARSCRSTRATWWTSPSGRCPSRSTSWCRCSCRLRETELPPVTRRAPASCESSAAAADRIQSHGLDSRRRSAGWHRAGLDERPRRGAHSRGRAASPMNEGDRTKSSVVQVTNLGITVKDSPQNTLIFVTRLDNGAPVAERGGLDRPHADNSTFWRGTTGADGTVIAPNTPSARPGRLVAFRFRRHRREGRRRRLRRQRLERRHHAVGVRHRHQPQRVGSAAARLGLHRPRRLQAR